MSPESTMLVVHVVIAANQMYGDRLILVPL
jgi:hypothetical protein